MPFITPVPDPAEVDAYAAKRGLPAWLLAVAVFVLCMGVTLWSSRNEQQQAQAKNLRSFVADVDRVTAAIHDQLRNCEQLIRSFQTIFVASEKVTQQEYSWAFRNLQASSARVSLQALAYAERRDVADGEHYITTMLAPLAGNTSVLGLDVATQPANLEALRRSRDSNRVAMSAPFRLVQSGNGSKIGDGFILRLPIYARQGTPDSLQKRRQLAIGSIGASFRIADLLDASIPELPASISGFVIDDLSDGGAKQLYARRLDSTKGLQPKVVELRFGGRLWAVRVYPLATSMAPPLGYQFWLGTVISVLLAALAWSFGSTRERAIAQGALMSKRYRASEERFRKLNELLPSLVMLVRKDDGTIVYRNLAARNKLMPKTGWMGLSTVMDPTALSRICHDTGGQRGTGDIQMRNTEGEMFWANAAVSSIEIDGIDMWLMVVSDISEQRLLTERLSYEASHDSLTRLFNRRELEARVQLLLSQSSTRRGALLFIDLDQFKLVNDTSGHRAGDELLVQLSAMMRDKLRPSDLLGRLGGDEFGVLLSGVADADAAMQAAERLRAGIEGFVFHWEQRSYMISASIGAVMLHDAANLKDLFAHADAACYLAKEAGRNRIRFYSETDAAVSSRLGEMEWANRVRDAISGHRLLLDYQELQPCRGDAQSSGSYIELLLRLRNPDGSEVPPGAFLPAAERYGLMPLIDRWVVETALTHLDELHPSGTGLALCAINLSGASFEDDDLYEWISRLIQEQGIDPSRLMFEVTETVAMRNFSDARNFISRLRKLGCRVALDDFGAGMSSFGYLKNLELDSVKIDGSFVQGMATDRMSQSIVKAITEIGHQQELSVVAEWVSSTELLEILRGLDVDYVQGFALHKPERVVFQRAHG